MISFHVDGDPQGQPRPRARYKGPKGVYTPSGKAKQWARTVEAIAAQHRPSKPLAGAVRIELFFEFKRPKSHYGMGVWSVNQLKKSAPKEHIQKPDIDNLEALVLNCLTRVQFWHDDAQVNKVEKAKQWTKTMPGVWIQVQGKE